MLKPISVVLLCAMSAFLYAQHAPQTVVVMVDARRVQNHVSPRMYASFVEMMAEDVKWGLTAEMLHDRSFEEAPSYLGLTAGWQLEPDERNDNVGAIRFLPTTDEAYPRINQATGAAEHSLRISVAPGDTLGLVDTTLRDAPDKAMRVIDYAKARLRKS